MKINTIRFFCANPAINELLAEHGINLTCHDDTSVIINWEDSIHIPGLVLFYMPEVIGDYNIEYEYDE